MLYNFLQCSSGDELYHLCDIFTRLNNVDDYKDLPTTFDRLEQEKLIDDDLKEKLSVLSDLSYTELRKLLVTSRSELLAQQISYGDDDDASIIGKGIEADTMESLLNTPNNIDIWKTLRKTIAQHSDKEKVCHPLNFIYCSSFIIPRFFSSSN